MCSKGEGTTIAKFQEDKEVRENGNSDTMPKSPIPEKGLECSVVLITKLLTQPDIGWGGGTRINSV